MEVTEESSSTAPAPVPWHHFQTSLSFSSLPVKWGPGSAYLPGPGDHSQGHFSPESGSKDVGDNNH